MTSVALAPVTAFPQEPRSRRSALRLTRRGRVVVGALIVLCVAAVLAIVTALAAPSAVASTAESSDEFSYVVAQPGDTLWGIATTLDDSVDPRDLVVELVRLNQLGDAGLQAGVPLAVPARYANAPGTMSAKELGISSS